MYSGMVPGFVAGQYTREQLEIDARPLSKEAGADLVVDRAVRIDAESRRIYLQSGASVSFDLASINIGSTVAGLDLPGIREHALPTRPITTFVDRIKDLIEGAKRHGSDDPFRIAVVGGGAGGLEIAFALQHRLRSETKRSIDVTLVHDGPEILTGHPAALVRRARRWAERRGIEIRCGSKVVAAERDAVYLEDGESLGCQALVWVTGPVSHPLFRDSGLPGDARGFVRIGSTLQVKDQEHLFAVGDCATFVDYPRTPKAGVYAVREGPFIAYNLRAMLRGEPLKTYTPQRDFLMLMNLGGGYAVGSKWGRAFEGKWVMSWKDRIDRKFVRRFQLRRAQTTTL